MNLEFDYSGTKTNGFYITLPEAKDRQKQIENELKKQPNLIIKPWFVNKQTERYTTDSHVAVMKEALKLGLGWVLIFEDDAILPDVDMHKTIRAVDAEVDGDWEVIIHGHKTKNMRAGDVTKISDLFVSDMNGNSSGSLFRVHRSVAGCHAYTVKGGDAMTEVIRIQSVSEYTKNGRIDVYDGWFKGSQPNKASGRHCLEGKYLREQDRWFITDLAYVTEQHIDGYSYRMKNVKHSRWDDESAKSWTTRLERQLPSPPKHVLIISYPGLTGEQIQEMCKGILDTNKVKGSVSLRIAEQNKTDEVKNLIRNWMKETKVTSLLAKKHVIFVVTGDPEFTLTTPEHLTAWGNEINQITSAKYKYDAEFERINNDKNRDLNLEAPKCEWKDCMFTIFHVEDWLLNARKASKFLSMRLGMDANKMTHVGNSVGPELHKSLVKVIDEIKPISTSRNNTKFKDPLEKARYK